MAKARDIVRMSEAEISVFLDQSQSLQVATLGPDGAPHLTTVWFTVHEGNVLFETYGKSQKIVNLKRDSRIAVLAEDGKTYATLRGVSINGRAEVVEDFPERLDLMRVLVASMHPELSDEAIDDRAAKMATKRVVVKAHPEKVMSWDHHKLGAVGP